ncbi:MAG TPA: lysylphosphatidylglycerol synthase transmembrane domain-containing protein [Caproiciproducens sp.]|nr:lysylphosphatidylglycerol synthase transmembrane domain-containing protein [Caproiciproducens sp.]
MINKLKASIRKNLFVIITLVLTVGVLLYFLFTTEGITTLGRLVTQLKPQWLFLSVAAAVGCWLLEGITLHLICIRLYPQWRFGSSFSVGMTGFLYSALTPFSTGGQPMQIYSMHKMGMDTGKAGSIIAVKTLTYQVIMVAYSLVAVAAKLHFFQTSVSNFSFVTIIGLLCNSIFILAVLLFMVSETLTDKILTAVIQFLHKIRLCKHPDERYEKIHSQLAVFHDASKLMGNSAKLYVLVTVYTVIQITLNSLIPYFIYRSFGLNDAPVTTMVAAQVFVAMVSAFVPLPGASGGAEGSFYIFFGMFFQSAILPAILVWRFLTYYCNILFGGIFSYIGGRRYGGGSLEEE